jgi:soluble lytic murein transglycosylase-like protein
MHLMSNDKVKSAVAVAGAFLLVLAVGTLGWAMLRGNPSSIASASWQDAAAHASEQPSTTVTSEPPPTTPPPTKTPTPKPSTTKKPTSAKKPTPIATLKPPPAQLPPPPPPQVPENPSCEQHLPGADAPASDVSAALAAAGAKQYWTKTPLPPPAPPVTPVPKITVPTNLMNAVAWAESSWRSTIISCDHGVGLMQVMSGTADWMNNRFGTNYDMNTVAGNTALGATYIEWLTMYFGAFYFGTFDLNATAAVGDGGATMRLGDVVISAYNWGPYALENNNGTPDDSSDDTLHPIPNQAYVDRVNGYYRTSCPCTP